MSSPRKQQRPPPSAETPSGAAAAAAGADGANAADANAAGADAEEDLAYDLDALDIDRDFNVWESFRSSLVSTCSGICGGAGAGAAADDSDEREYRSDAAVGFGDNSLIDDDSADRRARFQQKGGKPPRAQAQSSELTKDERDFIRKWAARVRKEELYSKYYRPVPREQREMRELAIFLGVPKEGEGDGGKHIGAKLKNRLNMNLKQKGELGAADDDTAKRPAVSRIFYPADDEPKSILLKREPVHLRADAGAGGAESSSPREGERELILVTRGFVVASVPPPPPQQEESPAGQGQAQQRQPPRKPEGDVPHPPGPPKTGTPKTAGRAATPGSPAIKKFMEKLPSARYLTTLPGQLGNLPAQLQGKVIRRNFESCHALAEVESVEDVALTMDPPTGAGGGGPSYRSFAVTVRGGGDGGGGGGRGRRLVFTCGKVEQKAAWIEALEMSVIQAHVLAGRGGDEPGWKHEVLRTSLYSAAVRDDESMMRRALASPRFKSQIDTLDSHGHAALHYAAMRNHLKAMEMLLKAGANANTMNVDQRVPMYFAERSKFDEAADLLEAHGGARSTVLDGAGELFGQAAQAVKETIYSGAPTAVAGAGGAAAPAPAARARPASKAAREKETEAKAKGAAGAMSDAMNALRERGERLRTLDDKTADLQNDASEYRSLARQMKEKAKKENKMFGF